MKTLLLMAFLIGTPLLAQSAKVIQLSPEDAKQAKALADEQAAISKKIEAFRDAVRSKYLTASKAEEGHTQTYSLDGHWVWVKQGWSDGTFEYSEDYRFIVPSSKPTISSPYGWGLGCGAITPAIGIAK